MRAVILTEYQAIAFSHFVADIPDLIHAIVDIQPMTRDCSINHYALLCFTAKIITLFREA
jgi:hypothetical protein